MTTIQRLCLVPFAAAVLTCTGCDRTPKEWTIPNMTALTPRLQLAFEKTKTVCFGRFIVDVPASTTVVWGEAEVPLYAAIYPGGVAAVKTLAQEFIDKLKSEKAINHDDIPLLLSVDNVVNPEGKIVIGYEDFEAINGLKINGYFRLNNDGVVFNTYSLMDKKDSTIALIKNVARRLRQRAENEVPTEPGNCVEHAFLPDELDTQKRPPAELVRIGFRLKEFPDTHLSIFVGPSNPNYTDSSSLEWRLERLEREQKARDPNNPLLKTKMFRRGPRRIHDWVNGFEALSRSPEQAEMHSIHDFAMDFRGVPSDPLRPYAEIQMQTGVAENTAGATKATLTDEEAIAVWDKITSSIRVRPTTATLVATSEAGHEPRLPLGELAATGRVCPQTGWWKSEESRNGEGNRRQHIKAGDRMPHLISLGAPSLWQKLKKERPSYRTATVWRLVSYEDAPDAPDEITRAAAIARASPGNNAGAHDIEDNTRPSDKASETSSQKKI